MSRVLLYSSLYIVTENVSESALHCAFSTDLLLVGLLGPKVLWVMNGFEPQALAKRVSGTLCCQQLHWLEKLLQNIWNTKAYLLSKSACV